MTTLLAQIIRRAWATQGAVTAIIHGERGLGKSTFAMLVLKELYGDWDAALRFTVFDINDVVSMLEGKRILALHWDDAGVHGSAYRWFTDRELVWLFSALSDVLRTSCAGFIMTVPRPAQVMKPLRETPGTILGKITIPPYSDDRFLELLKDERVERLYVMHAEDGGDERSFWYRYVRYVRYRVVRYNVLLQQYFKPIVREGREMGDIFIARLPDHVYERYLPMREEYARKVLDMITFNSFLVASGYPRVP